MTLVEILGAREECEYVRTLRFRLDRHSFPGQFVMVWIPGVDEIPMSLSYTGDPKGVTVESVGEATKALHELKMGDMIGVRGPFGNGFRIDGKRALVVGGGSGTACLAPLVESLCQHGRDVTCAVGARTGRGLLFVQRLEETGAEVLRSTDDGSAGQRGPVTTIARGLLAEAGFDQVYACGPEPMLVRMVNLCEERKVPLQCSLERYMKCGIGLCGSCQLGPFTVCRDGPVFDSEALARIPEFGGFKRAPSGRRIPIG